ncbi:MAG: glycogen/starch/alpha-glucan phosphorylase [Acidobacteriota bacterium]
MNKPKDKRAKKSTDALPENLRTGLDAATIARAVVDQLFYGLGRLPEHATKCDWYLALAAAVRDRLVERWIQSVRTLSQRNVKVVSYLSAEFLMGPQLVNNLINLGIVDETRKALEMIGLDLDLLVAQEEEPGLGNGGLGRLAACYLDSLATLQIPAIGYGIRYEYGIFDQQIRDGWQVEMPDTWLRFGNPWEIVRPEICFRVPLGGRTESEVDANGRLVVRWIPNQIIKGVAHDTPVPGYQVNTTNVLRLWKAEADDAFDLESFNEGDYFGAVTEKVRSENISKVLYPNDIPIEGKILRLQQQYFFVSCSLQDMFRIHLANGDSVEEFPASFAVQLNDTHPAIAVAELMRLLIDDYGIEWEKAWKITQATFGYTNHTLLPEALEKWSVELFGSQLPRHLEIIYEINARFLAEVKERFPLDEALATRVSLIDENGDRFVRMAHLATLGSHSINGVAALHTRLLEKDVLRDFFRLFPERFHSITNGVTPRRWMLLCNPPLSALISRSIGWDWVRRTEVELRRLEPLAVDVGFQDEWQKIKRENKLVLAALIKDKTGIVVDPASLFDVQVKRIHEYKRQHLNLLHVLTLYWRLKHSPRADVTPRTFVFGGKAAPGYALAKLIIKLIHAVADVVNNDPDIAGRLKVVFLPDFNVTNGQHIFPAADLSEQISTAGKEASGTGNMKFALNGALTIGTLDGANVEMREFVGPENFFLFGLTTDGVAALRDRGYNPRDYYFSNPYLREVLDSIGGGYFSKGDHSLFNPILDALLNRDEFFLCADYESYVDCQDSVGAAFTQREEWTRKSILNVARMGYFSSDRSIREYCDLVWDACQVEVDIHPV